MLSKNVTVGILDMIIAFWGSPLNEYFMSPKWTGIVKVLTSRLVSGPEICAVCGVIPISI